MAKVLAIVLLVLAFVYCSALSANAQTTAFTYQGSLKDGANPANGNYDFEFKLFDLVSAGSQQGFPIQRLNVAVANGVFTVSLNFGAGTLPGADRYLDIGVRTAGGGVFTALSPRQKVNSSPYAVRSLNSTTADAATNAAQLGGVAAAQYVLTTDPRMTDSRTPTAGSGNYVQRGADNSSAFSRPCDRVDLSKLEVESCAKQRIFQQKKDHDEMLKRGEEVRRLSERLVRSFELKGSLSDEDRNMLAALEKNVKKIRDELGGDDAHEKIEEVLGRERSPSFADAVEKLKLAASDLTDELKKTTRFTISATAIQSSNTVLTVARFLRVWR